MYFLLLLLLPFQSFALDAVITVLEAPLLKERDINSPVVQYKRKGDIIKLHPSLNDDLRYDHLKPSGMIEDEKFAYNEDEFIPTYDRLGNLAYVLREHIFIYFEDEREVAQLPLKKDPTDYRLQEPLIENYPLLKKTGYRGQFYLSVSQPYNESYPYPSDVKNEGYTLPLGATFNFMRKASYDIQDRLYFGVSTSFSTHENSFILSSNNQVEEKTYKFGIGPIVSYDAYKSTSTRITIMTSILVNLFHQFDITQTDRNQNSEMRSYRGYSFTPRLSALYTFMDVFPKLDVFLGTTLEADVGGNFKVDRGSKYAGWWQDPGSDSFKNTVNINVSAHLGLQARY